MFKSYLDIYTNRSYIMEEEKIKLNEKEMTPEEFEEKKKELEKQKGISIKEVKPNEYKTRIQG